MPRLALLGKVVAVLLAPVLVPSAVGGIAAPPPPRPEPVIASPLDGGLPVAFEAGRDGVELVEVLSLGSAHPGFGGLSGLWVEPGRFLAVSDRGLLWQARLDLAEDGASFALSDWRAHRVLLPGERRGRALDIEDITAWENGRYVLSTEQTTRLIEVEDSADGAFATRPLLPVPPPLDSVSTNAGIESLAALADGRLFAILERPAANPDEHNAAAFTPGQPHRRFTYRSRPGFVPTGAARLGDEIYVVERSFSLTGGLRAVVTCFPAAILDGVANQVIEPELLARFDARPIGANFEGIAAMPAEDGGVDLYLVSDDNFMALLPTLLVRLRLPPWPPEG
jgi:hypothetical protein